MIKMKKLLSYLLLFVLLSACSQSYNGELMFIEPENDDQFHYPYFLFIPKRISMENPFIIVEPNNSGFVDDDLEKHIEKAKRTATNDYYLGNYIAQNLKYPLLVPVFPREKTRWKIYTHSLDRDAMLQRGNSLERLDRQLLEMISDARRILDDKNISTREKYLFTGFSASGTFVNRFALLHPEKVFASAAGGLNGLLMLPQDSLQGLKLNYPIGTGDFTKIIQKDFQQDLFAKIPQFYFMGAQDDNDAVPYDDAFDEDERQVIYSVLGRQMLPERWNACKNNYTDNQVNAVIKIYEELGHKHPEKVKKEILSFFRKHINRNP
jgi:hypothetical protein